jgi:outer membrane biosynthesis protein TonB
MMDEDERLDGWMLNQQQIFVPSDPVPRVSFFSLSVLAHLVVLAILVLRHATAAHIVSTKYETVQTVSGAAQVAYVPPKGAPRPSPFHQPRSKKKAHLQNPVEGDAAGVEIIRAHAKQATAGLMVGIKQRLTYGFSTINYQLAVQTSGVIPTISADDLPPRFEQYLVVEVTIDIDGRVADARLTTGMATPKIEQTLLSAIRGFKYIPAKRDGSPIPCQIDLVIHIPS